MDHNSSSQSVRQFVCLSLCCTASHHESWKKKRKQKIFIKHGRAKNYNLFREDSKCWNRHTHSYSQKTAGVKTETSKQHLASGDLSHEIQSNLLQRRRDREGGEEDARRQINVRKKTLLKRLILEQNIFDLKFVKGLQNIPFP